MRLGGFPPPAAGAARFTGRPPVDPEKAAALRKLVDAGLTPGKAAKQLGIGRSTAYRTVREGRDGGGR